MKHVRPAFQVVFDIKVDFTRKAWFVAGGHRTEAPKSITYSSVVSRDSIWIAFLIVTLNDVDILAADNGNTYLNASTREKVHTTLGIEFGQNLMGRTAVISKALYGLKSSGAAWGHTSHPHCTICSSDQALLWLKPAVKVNGDHYYEYIIVYIDDILGIAEHPRNTMNCLANLY
jgi:hypothetical protein